jgi:hypothetical protein
MLPLLSILSTENDMGKTVRMRNGNIGYIVKENEYLDVTLNFSISKIDLDGLVLDESL